MPWSFHILALFTIASALAAMSLRNLVHCALCLALTFLGVAGLYLHLNAGFVAFAQILVYVGAVAILIVFAILLTRNAEKSETNLFAQPLWSVSLGLAVAAIFLSAIAATPLPMAEKAAEAPTVRQLGQSLMTTHVVPLEIIGVLLTVALLGAVLLALPESREGEPKGEQE